MAKLLITATHGGEDPTRAGLAFFVAKGAKEIAVDPSIVLAGDGTLLMKEAIRDNILPVGIPALKELFQYAVDHKIPIYV